MEANQYFCKIYDRSMSCLLGIHAGIDSLLGGHAGIDRLLGGPSGVDSLLGGHAGVDRLLGGHAGVDNLVGTHAGVENLPQNSVSIGNLPGDPCWLPEQDATPFPQGLLWVGPTLQLSPINTGVIVLVGAPPRREVVPGASAL